MRVDIPLVALWSISADAALLGDKRPIDPHLLGFSSYIGPVVNLTYDDPSLMKAVKALGVGSLRYPGGSPSNNWNISSGRWTGKSGSLQDRTAALPEGTFSPDAYMRGVGSLLRAPPIWNLNLFSLPEDEMVGQIDVLRRMEVPVERLELGNEAANNDCDTYLAKAALVVNRAREVFPKAEISIIGSWANPATGIPSWNSCERGLAAHQDLFDAVSVHTYSPGNTTISDFPDWAQPIFTLAAAEVLVRYHADQAAIYAGGKPMWLDEFNWGGGWMGGETWPALVHGALRGLHYVAFYLAVISLPAGAVGSLKWYSLFRQEGIDWSYWASCVDVPNAANRPDLVKVDGVAQVFSHLSYVALRQEYSEVRPVSGAATDVIPSSVSVFGTTGLPCVQACLFTGPSDRATFLMLNRCSWWVDASVASPLQGAQQVNVSVYDGDISKVGGWVDLDAIGSVDAPPWQNGPLDVEQWTWSTSGTDVEIRLSPVSLHFVQLTTNAGLAFVELV